MTAGIRRLTAGLSILALIVSGGAAHAESAHTVTGDVMRQQILERVREAAAPAATVEESTGDSPAAEGTIEPGSGAILDATDAGVRAEFSGHDLAGPLSAQVSVSGEGAAVSAASETQGVVAAPPVEIRARDDSGESVTQFPASYSLERDASGIEVAKDVEPGIRLALGVDADELSAAGVDLSSLRVYSRERAGEPWQALPSYFDSASGTVKAESEHLSEFVVIGTPVTTTPVPRIVLDPDDDAGWADSPGPRITELPLNVRLADGLAGMFRERCLADVTVTRGADQRFVSAETRRAVAASYDPDVTLTLAFNTNKGRAWGTAKDGGSLLFSRGGTSDALRDSLRAEMPGYTGRPAQVRKPTADFPREEYSSLPGAVVHMETLFMDHNFDRPVIDGGWDSIVNGAFTGVGKYLESQGFSCTNPVTGGWPARPSADQLGRWYALGYRNWQHYGADPVSFSTGNLVESEHLFSLPGAGGSRTDVSLVYNSQDGRLSRTGAGWSFGLGGRAQRFDDKSVLVVRGDGASILFEPDGAGGYADPRGEGLHLTEVGDGVLRMTSRDGETWEYDAADQDGIGELVRTVDAGGHTTTLTYGTPSDAQQFVPLTGITDASGQTVRVDSDDRGRITAFTLPDGRAWSLGYDAAGDLVRLVSPDGGAKTFAYDDEHRVTSMTDALGTIYLRNVYDDRGRVLQQWDAEQNLRRFDYRMGETVYTDQEGREHSYAFDDRARITSITGPTGDVQRWTYDDDDNITAFTDAGGRTTTYDYDEAGRVTQVTDALGATTRYTYTRTGNVASETDARGRVTAYAYDEHDALTATVLPDGSTVTYDVDDDGNVTRMTLPSGAAYDYEVDARGNRVASTDPLGRTTRLAYDEGNRLVASTDPLGRVARYEWDARDRVTAVVDPLGRTTRYSYDLNGNLTSSTDPAGNVTTFTWDALFRVVSATDPLGGTTSYSYDREDGLTATTDAAGRQTSFVLDALSRVTEATDAAGATWKQTYDGSGALASQTDPHGEVTTQTVDRLGRVTAVIGPTGIEQHTQYDEVGRVTSTSDALGHTTRYEYDDLDRLTGEVDAAGRRTSYSYDADGLLVGTVDRLGNPTLYERDAAGQVTTVTTPTGATTSYAYDAAGNVTRVTDPVGRATSFEYDDADQKVATVDAAGHRTTSVYDAVGNLLSSTNPNGHTTSATWDAAGNPLTVTDALGSTTRFAYDQAGQLTTVTDARGNVTSYTYESHGELATVRDAAGTTTSYAYDESGLLASVTDGRGNATTYGYDGAGLPEWMMDAAGHRTRYEYDRRGLLTRTVLPSGAGIISAYDEVGNLIQQSSASDTLRFEYDGEGRMIAASNAAGATGWTYTSDGLVASQIDMRGRELASSYDASGLLNALTVPDGAQISYRHDDAGRVSRMDSPWGAADYGYDDGGNLSSVRRSNGVQTTYGYDAADQVTSIATSTPDAGAARPTTAATPTRTGGMCPAVGGGSRVDVARAADVDTAGCSKPGAYLARKSFPSDTGALPQGASLSFAYGYDAVGNVTSTERTASVPTSGLPGGVAPAAAPREDASSGDGTTVLDRSRSTYTYDSLDRLVASTTDAGAEDTWGYDEVGNRTTWTHRAASTSTGVLDPVLTFDGDGRSVPRPPASIAAGSVKATDASFSQTQSFDELNRVVDTQGGPAGGVSYAYDDDGHRVAQSGGSGGSATYSWNELGQLLGYDSGGEASRFTYDALSRRVGTTTRSDRGETTTATVWDGWQPVQDESSVAGTTTLVRDAAGELLLEGRTSGPAVWDLLDRLGSAVAQVGDARLGTSLNHAAQQARDASNDRSAQITQVSAADEWGSPSFSTSGWNAAVGHSGERSDPSAGLDLFYSRGYDTASGSWLSQDSWGGVLADPLTMNGYAFVTGNPVTLRDQLGFAPVRRLDGGRTKKRSPQLSVPSHVGSRFPGARTTPAPAWHPPMSSPRAQSPAATWPTSRRSASGTTPSTKVGRWSPPKPAATSPRTVSQPTARHTNVGDQPPRWRQALVDASQVLKWTSFGVEALALASTLSGAVAPHPLAKLVLLTAGPVLGHVSIVAGALSVAADCIAYGFDGQCGASAITWYVSSMIAYAAPGIGPQLGAFIFDSHLVALSLVPTARRSFPS
ncbi:DUF6531 domain-containing protein [Microbacterium sp. LMI1-1-1.1]|uniref:DUF6531 domain-containing protein n=1 Tax=Microbacterium sp. LMI1-1-1.1 TaxID=3135223 RepID=UPI0034659789